MRTGVLMMALSALAGCAKVELAMMPDAGCAGLGCEDAGAALDAGPAVLDAGTDASLEDAAAPVLGDAGPPPPPACALGPDSPLVLLYASVGGDDNLQFLDDDCAAEVVVGEKREAGPRSAMRTPAAHARGGRTAYIYDQNGAKIRDALRRTDGVRTTAAEIQALLDAGYDYIVIDEITAAAEWADGTTVNRRFRSLLELLPERTVIAYVSLDLTMAAGGGDRMAERRQLLYSLYQHGRALALEVYLHTAEARSGAAPDAFATAARRLRSAVLDLPGGGHIDDRAITVLGMSIHCAYPQYCYLDSPAYDLASVRAQARALRTGGALLTAQRGIGYYYVGRSDLEPRSGAPYDFPGLLGVMTEEARLASQPITP